MQMSRTDVRALAASGYDALRRGDAREARESFEQVVSQGQPDARALLALAHACGLLGDAAASLVAVDKALALEPRNFQALIFKADHLAALGDDRAASSHYQFAVRAAPPADGLAPELRRELDRARAMGERYARKFEQFLLERLQGAATPGEPTSARFRQSLDIMLGKKNIYFQQPQAFYFPELPQIQFYEPQRLPLDRRGRGRDRRDPRRALRNCSRTAPGSSLMSKAIRAVPARNNRGCRAIRTGARSICGRTAGSCPRTSLVVRRPRQPLPRFRFSDVSNRSPSILFSLLRPGARIPPHSGLVNTRLICHLPLIVPPGCGFRVGNDTRTPVEGKVWAFDDTIEHEAWNNSDKDRVILLFEVWRPELTDAERGLVRAMFDAIDAYSGQPPSWSI